MVVFSGLIRLIEGFLNEFREYGFGLMNKVFSKLLNLLLASLYRF